MISGNNRVLSLDASDQIGPSAFAIADDSLSKYCALPFWILWKQMHDLPGDTTPAKCFYLWLNSLLGDECNSWEELGKHYVEWKYRKFSRRPISDHRHYLAAQLSRPIDTPWPELLALSEVLGRLREYEVDPRDPCAVESTMSTAIMVGVIECTPGTSFDFLRMPESYPNIVVIWWQIQRLWAKVHSKQK